MIYSYLYSAFCADWYIYDILCPFGYIYDAKIDDTLFIYFLFLQK